MMKHNSLMQVGELAKKVGTSVRTIRYYEELGLIVPLERSAGGFRLYTEETLEKVQMIQNLKLLDLPLTRIKELLNARKTSSSGRESAPKVMQLLQLQLQETEAKITKYLQMRASIQETLEIVKHCLPCEEKPSKDTCMACEVIHSREELPLPMRALI